MNNEYELYFYFEGDHESEELDAVITPMCCKCHDTSWGYLGFWYKGPLTPYKYVCGKCQGVIKDGIEDDGQVEIIEE